MKSRILADIFQLLDIEFYLLLTQSDKKEVSRQLDNCDNLYLIENLEVFLKMTMYSHINQQLKWLVICIVSHVKSEIE